MSGCSKYLYRLKKALEYNELELPTAFIEKVSKRAKTDGDVDWIAHALLNVLEPPYCQMSHCAHHSAYGFAGCSKSLIPGKCAIHKEYIKNKQARELKIKKKLIDMIAKDKKVTPEYAEANFDFERFKSIAGGISRVIKHYEKSRLSKN